jgi:hypothetical protein
MDLHVFFTHRLGLFHFFSNTLAAEMFRWTLPAPSRHPPFSIREPEDYSQAFAPARFYAFCSLLS